MDVQKLSCHMRRTLSFQAANRSKTVQTSWCVLSQYSLATIGRAAISHVAYWKANAVILMVLQPLLGI